MVFLSIPKETPRADPHAGCCGSRGRETPGDPIGNVSSWKMKCCPFVFLRRPLGDFNFFDFPNLGNQIA